MNINILNKLLLQAEMFKYLNSIILKTLLAPKRLKQNSYEQGGIYKETMVWEIKLVFKIDIN